MPYAVLTVILVALDQLVKYLVLENIPLGQHVPFIPYILDLTYVQNTGAAFSMFNQHTWILTLVSLVMSVVLAAAVWKNFFRHPLGKLCLTLVLGGAIGNLIDRAFRGFVVDMFDLTIFSYPVFNVADCFVVVGAILGAVYYLWLYEKFDARKKNDDASTDGDK